MKSSAALRLVAPILAILLLGQIAGGVHSQVRPVRLSAPERPPVDVPDDGSGEVRTIGRMLSLEESKWLFDKGDAIVFIDARLREEFEAGRIPGAFHLDPLMAQGAEMGLIVDSFAPDQRIVIYCGGGDCDASKVVENELSKRGFFNLHIFEAGFPAWVEAGYDVEGAP